MRKRIAGHPLPKELVMAMRIVALLIPLAITLPQLQASRPRAAAQEPVAHVQPAAAPEWSYEARRSADVALTPVVLDPPVHETMSALDSPAPVAATQATAAAVVCKAPSLRTASKLVHSAPLAKGVRAVAASPRAAPGHVKRLAWNVGCEPGAAHCAPVEVAKVTPVSRRSL
jgi:hypothetical protein